MDYVVLLPDPQALIPKLKKLPLTSMSFNKRKRKNQRGYLLHRRQSVAMCGILGWVSLTVKT
jgi:hypothetical protein